MMKRVLFILFLLPAILMAQGEYRPGDHELLVSPTAFTMPKGNSYVADYQLFFLNYTYAITSRTHIGAFILFPIAKGFEKFFSLGIKQNYLQTPLISGAVWYSHNFESKFGALGNAITLGNYQTNLTINIGAITDYNDYEILFSAGGVVGLTKHVKILAEYMNTKSLLEESDFSGLIGFGFRFQGSRISFDIAGARPFQEDIGDLIAITYLKAIYLFK